MSNLLRLAIGGGLVAIAILGIAIGLARNTTAMAAPAHLLLFLIVLALYLVPSGIALHRNCVATAWIVAVNVLLGWTLFGWAIALGWAASGKTALPSPAPPIRPLTGR